MSGTRFTMPRVTIIALSILVIALGVLRLLLDRPPGGSLGLAWPEHAYAAYRVNAVLVALTVGAALGVSGLLLQVLLRNPLASPFILGLSSGAGLGVTAWMYVGYVTGLAWITGGGSTSGVLGWLAAGTNALPAFAGAMVVLMIVYVLGQRRGWIDPISLVLTGVVISAVCSAATMFLQHLAPGGLRADMMQWMFGHIPQGISAPMLSITMIATGVILLLAWWLGRAMDVATFSEDEARSIGLPLGPLRIVLFTAAGLLAALSVSIAGPIGFVGIMAPHAGRMLVGPGHRTLVVATALCGMVVLLVAEVSSQVVYLEAGRMPVGIFTAALGGPAFIWLLRSRGGAL